MLRCAPDVSWRAESDGIRVLAPDRALTLKLGYPEAALWDMITRGVAGQRAITMMLHIGGFGDEAAAAAFITSKVQEWQRLDLLVAETGPGLPTQQASSARR
jgi:hypothetical protein